MKIAIIGNGGSGKSTLAKLLSDELKIDVTHLDKLVWDKNFNRIPVEEFLKSLHEIYKKESWIIEWWAYQTAMYERLRGADVIIYLEFPFEFCRENILKRNDEFDNKEYPFDNFTGSRTDKTDLYLEAIKRVHNEYEPEVKKWLAELSEKPDKKIFIYNSREQLNEGIDKLINDLQ